MKVKIVSAGEYMNTKLRVNHFDAGEILETQGWYGVELIEKKLAKPLEVEKEPTKPEEPIVEPDLNTILMEERLGKVEEQPIVTDEPLKNLKIPKPLKTKLIKEGLNSLPAIEGAIKTGTLIPMVGTKDYRVIKTALTKLEAE